MADKPTLTMKTPSNIDEANQYIAAIEHYKDKNAEYNVSQAGKFIDFYDKNNTAQSLNPIDTDFGNRADFVAGRQPLTMAGPNTVSDEQWRAKQSELARQLMAQSQGNAPSAAELAFGRASDRNMANTMSMVQSARGADYNAALRNAMFARAMQTQDSASQMAQIRAQEQAAARNALGGVLQQGRGGDFAMTTAQQNAEQQNLQAMMQQRQQSDASWLAAKSAQATARQSQQQYDFNRAQTALANVETGRAREAGLQSSANAQATQGAGAGMAALGAILAAAASAASDKNLKNNIKDGTPNLREFLGAINTHAYKYKDKSLGEGEHVSPMAQELEKTKLGKSMVADTPIGKIVDYGKGFGAMLAAQAMFEKRISALEGKAK